LPLLLLVLAQQRAAACRQATASPSGTTAEGIALAQLMVLQQ
jgi:hypothetical protein